MGVRIDIGLDFEGNHTFTYEPCDGPRALDVPESVLRRWAGERAAFAQARARWQAVVAEIDGYLVRCAQADTEPFAAESRAFDSSPLDASPGGNSVPGGSGNDARRSGAGAAQEVGGYRPTT